MTVQVLVVEDGTGLPDANTYISEPDADAYIGAMPEAVRVAWDALSENHRFNLLVYATRVLDQKARWNGSKAVATSALRWPRTGVLDVDKLPIPHDEIPEALKDAVCELALWFSNEGRNPNTLSDSQGIASFTVDVISVTYKESHDATASLALPRGLNEILRGLGVIQYGGKASFGQINKV